MMSEEGRYQRTSYWKSYHRVKCNLKKYPLLSLPLVVHLFRQLSFFLTPIFLYFRISANTATFIKFTVGLISCLFVMNGQHGFLWGGIGFYFSYHILDNVDGNIARVSGTCTYYGKFIEAYTDIVFLTLFNLAMAYYIHSLEGATLLFWLSIGCAVIIPHHNFIFDRYSTYARWINEQEGVNIEPYLVGKSNLIQKNVYYDIQCLFLFFTVFTLHIGLVGYLVMVIIDALNDISIHLKAVSQSMRISKVSPKLAEDFQPDNESH